MVREEAGLTRTQVVALLDPPVSIKTLERWEKGESPSPTERWRQLAMIYRVPRKRLVTGMHDNPCCVYLCLLGQGESNLAERPRAGRGRQ